MSLKNAVPAREIDELPRPASRKISHCQFKKFQRPTSLIGYTGTYCIDFAFSCLAAPSEEALDSFIEYSLSGDDEGWLQAHNRHLKGGATLGITQMEHILDRLEKDSLHHVRHVGVCWLIHAAEHHDTMLHSHGRACVSSVKPPSAVNFNFNSPPNVCSCHACAQPVCAGHIQAGGACVRRASLSLDRAAATAHCVWHLARKT